MTAYDAALMTRRAEYYLRLGLALTPVKWGTKRPAGGKGWNARENLLTSPEQVGKWYRRPFNIGVQLGASGLVSVDVDDLGLSRADFARRGLDVDQLIADHPHPIQGSGIRLWYRAQFDDPITTRRFHEEGGVTAYEIRGGEGYQDVAPGSLHPDGFEYRWSKTAPRKRDDLPELPAFMYDLYATLGEKEAKAEPHFRRPAAREYFGDSLIEKFNSRFTVHDILERNGYKRRGNRYLSPNSKTGDAGVEVYDDQGKPRARTHHTSDFWNDGHGHDAFGLMMVLEHGGSLTDALDAARLELGLPAYERPQQTATPAAPTYTREEVTALWEAHGSEALERAMQYVSDAHHKAKDAMIGLLATTYHAASEGNISETPRGWAVEVGGLKTFAALLGCKPGDLRARLETASDHGLIGGAYRIKPEDPRSGYRITLPADPRSLRFLTLGKPAAPLRPDTTSVRRGRNGLSAPRCKKQGVAGVPINPAKPKNPLRSVLRVALTLSRHPGLTPKELATRLGMRLDTTRRKLSELNALGYLTEGGALRCTFRQFFEDMRAEEGEHARLRLYTVLEKQIEYARRSLRAARLGDASAKRAAPRMKKLEGRAYGRLERLRYGEAAHAVLGVAA